MKKYLVVLLLFWTSALKAESLEKINDLFEQGAKLTMGIEDTPIDFPKGLAMLLKACEANHPIAIYCLACFYLKGEGVPKDPKRARALYRQSSELGYGPAQFNAGIMEKNGQGGPKDLVMAFVDLSYATANREDLEDLVEDATFYRDQVAKDMTPDDVSKAWYMLKNQSAS